MFVVYFYENNHQLLNQLSNRIPSVGESIKIKGRKGKISNIEHDDGIKVHVKVVFEKIKKK